METIELKYFLETAKTQNIHKASESLYISPSAISKAIARLENQLEVKLFEKVGRNIKLTDHGEKLIDHANQILALKKYVKESYNINKSNISLRIVGPELPLSQWAPNIIKKIQKKLKSVTFQLDIVDNDEALSLVNNYSADFAIFSSTKQLRGEMYKPLNDVKFKTFISKKHPLALQKNIPSTKKILNEKFAVIDSDFFGTKSSNKSLDGWRDDKLKRTNTISTTSLKCLESLLLNGLAISYLPEYYGNSLGLKPLTLSDCPYSCSQKIYIARNKYSLDSIWSLI